MYCSGCGVELQTELNYCNRCGSRVSTPRSTSVADNLSQGISYVGGFGLLGFIFAVLVMLRKGVPTEALVPLSFFYLAALFGICFLITRQIAAQTGKYPAPFRKTNPAAEENLNLRPLTTAQLIEPARPPASVVDHTTQTLDKTAITR